MSDARLALHVKTSSAAGTKRVAAALARGLRAPCVLLLSGDLGAGKTTFAQGFVAALPGGAGVVVQSPTFALARTYETTPPVHHLDLYRLDDLEGARELGLLEMLDDDAAYALVEWPRTIAQALRPARTASIRITAPSARRREIVVDAPRAVLVDAASFPAVVTAAAAG